MADVPRIYGKNDSIAINLDEWEVSELSERNSHPSVDSTADSPVWSDFVADPSAPSVPRADRSPRGELEATYEIIKPARSWGEFHSSASESSSDSDSSNSDEEENVSVCSTTKHTDVAETEESPQSIAETYPLDPRIEHIDIEQAPASRRLTASSSASSSGSASVMHGNDDKCRCLFDMTAAPFEFSALKFIDTETGAIAKSSNDDDELELLPISLELEKYAQKIFDDQHTFMQNTYLQAKIEHLENLIREKKDETASLGSLRSAILQRNVDDYTKKINEMIDCSFTIEDRFEKERTIIAECADMIKNRKTFTDAKSLAEFDRALKNYRKSLIQVQLEILREKQKMIRTQKQYQKILSDYNHLVLELNAHELENEKMASIDKVMQKNYAEIEKSQDKRDEELNKREAELAQKQKEMASIDKEQQKKYAEIEKRQDEREEQLKKREDELALQRHERTLLQSQIKKLATIIDTLEEEKDKLTAERKSIADAKETEDRQSRMQEFEAGKMRNQIKLLRDENMHLRQKHCEFSNSIDAMKAENDSMRVNKNALLQERDFLIDTNKMLKVELASIEDKHKDLQQTYASLQSNFCRNLQDLKNFKDELAGAHEIIEQLQRQNNELHVNANAVEAYKIQMEEREKHLLDMLQVENNYLHQIEKLSNENREFQEEIERLKSHQRISHQ